MSPWQQQCLPATCHPQCLHCPWEREVPQEPVCLCEFQALLCLAMMRWWWQGMGSKGKTQGQPQSCQGGPLLELLGEPLGGHQTTSQREMDSLAGPVPPGPWGYPDPYSPRLLVSFTLSVFPFLVKACTSAGYKPAETQTNSTSIQTCKSSWISTFKPGVPSPGVWSLNVENCLHLSCGSGIWAASGRRHGFPLPTLGLHWTPALQHA